MKLKHSKSNLKVSVALLIALVSLVLCTVIRCVQLMLYIDPATGFSVGGTALSVVLYSVLGISLFAVAVISFLSKDTMSFQPIGRKDSTAGIFTVIFTVSLIYNWVSCFFSSIIALGTGSVHSGFKGLMASGALTLFLESLFAFLSAVYFVAVSIDFFRGTYKAGKLKVLAISPVVWASVRLVHRFLKQISFIEVSDLLLELIMLSLTALFFMAFAQVNSGIYSKDYIWRISGFGLPAAVLAVTVNISRLITGIISGGAMVNKEYPFSLADFTMGIMIFFIIISLVKAGESFKQQEE